jgi:hypothetical protein
VFENLPLNCAAVASCFIQSDIFYMTLTVLKTYNFF